MESKLSMRGSLATKKISKKRVPLPWKLRNMLRVHFIMGLIYFKLAELFTWLTKIPTLKGRLRIELRRANGERIDFGIVSYRMVTDAFVEFMVDELQAETVEWGDFLYHDSGEGTTGAAVGDTDIETTDGENRGVGNQGEGATAEIYKSVGTIAYTSSKAITEHGLFNNATGVTLMDRHTFAAINVIDGDSIVFTYELTCTSGG